MNLKNLIFSNIYKNIPSFGLDISDFSIKIAQLKKKRNGFDLKSANRFSLPEGVIQEGEIKNEKKLAEFRNKHIGFVFQFHHLLPEFTALENVCIPAFIGRVPRNKAIAKAKELLGFLGLAERLDHKPSELSGGEQQRVAVARALINDPSVILADEPSGNLDSASSVELHKLFFKLRDEFRQTFIIVTHNLELANMADRKLTIKDGIIQNG